MGTTRNVCAHTKGWIQRGKSVNPEPAGQRHGTLIASLAEEVSTRLHRDPALELGRTTREEDTYPQLLALHVYS